MMQCQITFIPRVAGASKPFLRKGRSWRPVKKSTLMVSNIDMGSNIAQDEASHLAPTAVGLVSNAVSGENAVSEPVISIASAEAVRATEETVLKLKTSLATLSKDEVAPSHSGSSPSHASTSREEVSIEGGLVITAPAVAEEEEQPFILVSRRKGGRKAAKSH